NKLCDHYLKLLRITGDNEYLTKAGRAAEESLKAVPVEHNTGGPTQRARVELTSHRFAAARDTARQLRALLPGRNGPLLLLGDTLLELGDYKEARRAYDEVIRDDGVSVDTEPRLARLDIIYGRLDSAREHFNKALSLVEKSGVPAPEPLAWCHVQIGELAFKQGDWDSAEKHYLAAIEALPEGYSAQEHLA